MLPGVIIKPLKRMPDERGTFTEVYRKDWTGIYGSDTIMQANLSNYFPRPKIRACTAIKRGQNDYFLVIKGP